MAQVLTEAAYRELRDAVGPANASREPAVLDGYAWQPVYNENPVKWVPRPVAVVLPGATDEVQEVVRACNRHGLRFKAFSTGWGRESGPSGDDVVQIDLRRMNRILEIDEKNMYAVVEPYVCGAELQAEAMKRGLNTHLTAANPGCSPLASATSYGGVGWDSIYMGHGARNLLGVEWVLPDGEVLRLGTPGSGLGWFTADGPGPSLRGIMRGLIGALGGMGVISKCSLKLYDWPGPARIETRGTVLDSASEVPGCLRTYACVFKSRESWVDAVYEIGEAEIGYISVSMAPGTLLHCVSPRLTRRLARTATLRDVLGKGLANFHLIVLKADSDREMEYQERAMRAIAASNDGVAIEIDAIKPLASMLIMNILRTTAVPLLFRVGGTYQFASNAGREDVLEVQADWARAVEKLKKDWIEKGLLVDDMGPSPLMLVFENNMMVHLGEAFMYDTRDSRHLESVKPVNLLFMLESLARHLEPLLAQYPDYRGLTSPLLGGFNSWQKSISRIFDPGQAADRGLYCSETRCDVSVTGRRGRELMESIVNDGRE